MSHESSTTTEPTEVRSLEEQDGAMGSAASAVAAPKADEAVLVDEVSGQVGEFETESDGGEAHAEVQAELAEGGEEWAEASPEQLAAPPDGESALSDLRLIEGFEEFGGAEGSPNGQAGLLPVAGTAIEGRQEEFIPFIVGLAAKAIPLLSTVGPQVVRALMNKLSPKARKILERTRKGSDQIAVLQRLLAQAMKRPEASAESVDESIVEELAETMEVILGTDDRLRITNTTKVPWRRYCALRIEFPSGAVYRGTGFFIGPRAVATAGHCVYLHNQGGWARRVEVIPGCNGDKRPFGSTLAKGLRATAGWTQNRAPAADYGAILLPVGAFHGQQLGHFGFGVFQTSTLLATPVVVAGYPGDKPFAELWGMSRRIKAATATQLIYDHDTVGGQSGAPVYMKHNGKRYVVGIHNYGSSTGNTATRVTTAVVTNFKRWAAFGVPATPPAGGAPAPRAAGAPTKVPALSGAD